MHQPGTTTPAPRQHLLTVIDHKDRNHAAYRTEAS
jgi:hypothetical protein